MGKDDKEDTGFGFKDRAKAEETLRLLEEHEPNYRRLTVRGLLGRAKRVLSLTKAEDKIKNIKEAMDVFETWLAELDLNKKTETKDKKEPKRNKDKDNGDKDEDSSDVEMEEKPEKKELPSDKVPNLGFKDPEAVAATFKELQGRDPEYQKFAVKGLIGSANRVLTCTKDETKLANIKEAIQKFEKFLDDFETQHLMKQHNPYLSLGIVRSCLDKTDAATTQQKSFIAAYASVNGEYKRLRTVKEKDGGKTWDIVRNSALKELKEKNQKAKLFNDDDEPTKEHLELLLWAYSPEAAKVKKVIPEKKEQKEDTEKKDSRKRKSSGRDESPSKKQKDD